MPLIWWFHFDSLTLLFWFDLSLKARAEILTKISLGFWSIKDVSKLTNLYIVKDKNSKPYLKFKYSTSFSAHVLLCLDTIVEAHYKGIYTSEKRGLSYVK